MVQELTNIIPSEFPDHSRVWIFQSSRAFIDKEVAEINEQLEQFYVQWQTHGAPVKGWAKLIFKQFILVIADNDVNAVGGCSTDSMVRVIKSLERQYDVNMFDRLMLTFLVNGKAEMLPLNHVKYAIEQGKIDANTPLFNNTIQNKKELMENWLIPIKDSWLASKLSN